MDAIKVKDIMETIEKVAPRALAEAYDNVGLLVGDSRQQVRKVIVGLEVTDSLIEEAISKGCELIVVHHPLIFLPLKSITQDDSISRKVIRLIKENISLYVAHTNLDKADGGLNDYLCKILGLKPNKKLNSEEKDLIRICDIEPQSFSQLIIQIRDRLNLKNIRYVGSIDASIERIGVCSGSGMSLFDTAIEKGIDAYITGDVKYHDAVKAMDCGIPVIDAGHFGTEIICRQLFENILTQAFKKNIKVYQHEDFFDPIRMV
jgi:dinuclear metal center YbgI/SA1388 family protein